jgi:hypothetical protein
MNKAAAASRLGERVEFFDRFIVASFTRVM